MKEEMFNELVDSVKEMQKIRHSKGKGCWYKTSTYWCVLCGRETIDRQRKWGPKPKEWCKRNESYETLCGGHYV